MQNSTFREKALNKLSSPEHLDRLLQVTSPKAWVALIGFLLVVVAAVAWGILGSIATVVPAGGLLVRQDGIQALVAPQAGQIAELDVKAGDMVKEGQLIGKIKTAEGSETSVQSNYSGKVLELPVSPGMTVTNQSIIASFDLTAKPLQAILLLPLVEGKQLYSGLKVQVSPSTVKAQDHGYMQGTISYVSDLPVSRDTLLSQIKNPQLVQALSGGGSGIEVIVNLEQKPTNFSGYAWSAGDGPHTQLTNGTFCTAQVVLGEQSPISLLLPIFHKDEG